jgi:SAM-dependent methyltransferase
VIHSQRFVLADGHSVPDRYDVVCCDRCGAAFADTGEPQARYDDLYGDRSRYASGPAAHARGSERDLGRFRDVAEAISRVVPEQSARIVDVGCANGELLRAFGERGYQNLCGIDPSPACVREAADVPHARAFVGSLSQIPPEAGPCDVAILSHVLEHVRDVQPALRCLRSILSDTAVLYVEVPDAMRYGAFVRSPFQDFNTEHINHFSMTSLDNVLRRSGFVAFGGGAKEILSAPGMPYPAVFRFASVAASVASAAASAPPRFEPDESLKSSLEAYVRLSRQLMEDIDARLRRMLTGAAKVVVWGTGELTAKLLADTVLAHTNVVAFVDGNPANQGRILRGLRILPPGEWRSHDETIVVASILHEKAIAGVIRGLGLRNTIVSLTGAGEGTDA